MNNIEGMKELMQEIAKIPPKHWKKALYNAKENKIVLLPELYSVNNTPKDFHEQSIYDIELGVFPNETQNNIVTRLWYECYSRFVEGV